MENKKNIYDLDLHESIKIEILGEEGNKETWRINRVPGGFIYYCYKNEQNTFVPYHHETRSNSGPQNNLSNYF